MPMNTTVLNSNSSDAKMLHSYHGDAAFYTESGIECIGHIAVSVAYFDYESKKHHCRPYLVMEGYADEIYNRTTAYDRPVGNDGSYVPLYFDGIDESGNSVRYEYEGETLPFINDDKEVVPVYDAQGNIYTNLPFPDGSKTYSFSDDRYPYVRIRYDFNDEGYLTLVGKGFYHAAFKPPKILFESGIDIPITIRYQGLRSDPRINICDVENACNIRVNDSMTGYNLADEFESILEQKQRAIETEYLDDFAEEEFMDEMDSSTFDHDEFVTEEEREAEERRVTEEQARLEAEEQARLAEEEELAKDEEEIEEDAIVLQAFESARSHMDDKLESERLRRKAIVENSEAESDDADYIDESEQTDGDYISEPVSEESSIETDRPTQQSVQHREGYDVSSGYSEDKEDSDEFI